MVKRCALVALLILGGLGLALFLENLVRPEPARAFGTHIFIRAAWEDRIIVQNDGAAGCGASGAEIWIGHDPMARDCQADTPATTVVYPGVVRLRWTALGLAQPHVGDYACLKWQCTTPTGLTGDWHVRVVGPSGRPTQPPSPPSTPRPTPAPPPTPTPRSTPTPPPSPPPQTPTPRPTPASWGGN